MVWPRGTATPPSWNILLLTAIPYSFLIFIFSTLELDSTPRYDTDKSVVCLAEAVEIRLSFTMGSVGGAPLEGQFMQPVINAETENDDPWKRNYFQPPQLKKLVPRTYPLIDIRPTISDAKYAPADLLQSHGFGVVRHKSALLEPPYVGETPSETTLSEVYHPEIQELVKKTTGAQHVFIQATVQRRGKEAPAEYKLPTGLAYAANKAIGTEEKKEVKPKEKEESSKPATKEHRVALAAPVRIPHMDFTPLGARQTIRSQTLDIYNTAVESGIIAAEDKICENHAFAAHTKEADHAIAEKYNQGGKLGPRYAAYSVWRPLKKVERDPLALAPWKSTIDTNGDLVFWPYTNKIPGPPELGGDFLKEYAMLGVQGEEAPASQADNANALKWYYLSAQEPEEVLIIKFFDSAALGENAAEAGAPFHASPEIGGRGGERPRESIELRVLAIW
jgi:hypothetical protein